MKVILKETISSLGIIGSEITVKKELCLCAQRHALLRHGKGGFEGQPLKMSTDKIREFLRIYNYSLTPVIKDSDLLFLNSIFLLVEGMKPVGRKIIIITSSPPKASILYCSIPRNTSGRPIRMTDPRITPGMLPIPPMIIRHKT